MVALMPGNDYRYQLDYVLARIDNLLACVDLNYGSPSAGCAHLAYWRDKTSGHADIRRQEFAYALAILYCGDFPGSPRKGDQELLTIISSMLSFWAHEQHGDGSFDEWYDGERAYAGAAFSAFAALETLRLIGRELPPDVLAVAETAARRGLDWLQRRDDFVKCNHEAVGIAALAAGYAYFGGGEYRAAALDKFALLEQRQQPDGWFPELGRFDVGYTFVSIDYLLRAGDLLGCGERMLPACRRAFALASEFIHPDFTTGPEYSICHNDYVSRYAIARLRSDEPRAAWLHRQLQEKTTGFLGIRPICGDELRQSRWSFLPLLAWQEGAAARETYQPEQPIPLAAAAPATGLRHWPNLGLATFNTGQMSGVIAAIAGGGVHVFTPAGGEKMHCGYRLTYDGVVLTNIAYGPVACTPAEDGNELQLAVPLVPVHFFAPSPLARALLWIGCRTATTSRLTRKLIDMVRMRRQTALNQSSGARRQAQTGALVLQRRVALSGATAVIDDTLSAVPAAANVHAVTAGVSAESDGGSGSTRHFRSVIRAGDRC